MAKITLRIEADASGVKTALTSLKEEVSKLAGTKIDLGIDSNTASSIAKASKAMADLERAQANTARASAQVQTQIQRTIQAHEKTAQAIEKTRQAEEKTAQSSNRLAEARERTYQAEERTTQAFERTYQAQEKTAQGASNLAIAQQKTEQTANRLATEQEKTARATLEAGSAAGTASGKFDALSVALGNIASRAFHLVLSKITQGLRDALKEMKDVDTQLTNISKVSGITGQSLADMGERAYETASKYGVSADEYLSAVYTFQKAGLGPSAEAMGELAVKTMLVGDTTADVASKFLISANAAWKMGGDIDRLNQVVDEADYINNNYATDLGKLSEGLPRVASVAAQSGMSVEETLAAIGTITAVTQESGTKSATALRALILNIEGQIGEFVDDTGETFEVTEESVKSMQGLMEKYAKAELDAARASGELINPMTAIKAIFEGIANEDLNDQDLFALLSGMGGKLRTNQLTALVQNFEMYDDMLKQIARSAGTADSEIALMMESWEKKTQVLKNTWAEFIADIVDTDTIKGAIDGLTDIIKGLDDLLFKDPSERTQSKYSSLMDELSELESRESELNGIEAERLQYLRDQTAELQEQARIQAEQEAKAWQRKTGHAFVETGYDGMPLYTDQAYYESMMASFNNATGQFGLGNLNSSEYIQAIKDVVSANKDYYDNLVKCKEAGVGLTDWQEQFVSEYENINQIAEAGNVELQDTAQGYYNIVDAQGNVLAWTDKYSTLQEQAAKREQEQQRAREEAEAQRQAALEESTAAIDRDADAMIGLTEGAENAGESTEGISTAAEGISFLDAIAQALQLAAALGDAAANAQNIAIGGGGVGFAAGTTNAPGGRTLVNELGPELISENGRAYIANGGKPAVVNLSKGAIVLPANVTRDALRGGKISKTIHAAASGTGPHQDPPSVDVPRPPTAPTPPWRQDPGDGGGGDGGGGDGGNGGGSKGRENQGPNGEDHNSRTGPGGGGGGGGPRKSKKDKAKEAAEKLEEKLTNLDKQATLANNEKRYKDERSIYRKAIKLINEQIEKYKKAGFKDTSNEVLDLKNKVHDYEKKIESAKNAEKDEANKKDEEAEKKLSSQLSNIDKQATLAKTEKRYGDEKKLYRKAISLIKKQLSAYKKAGYKDTSDAVVDLKNKIHDYESKISSADKAQWDEVIDAKQAEIDARRKAQEKQEKEDAVAAAKTALANAQNQRTVRMFNAQTGQWEWIADQAAIDQAQKQLDSANEAILRAKEDEELEKLRKKRDSGAAYKKGKVGSKVKAVPSSVTANSVGASFLNGIGGTTGGGTTTVDTSTTGGGNTSVDSHDINYNFGNITIGQTEAESTSVADLAKRLSVLNIS